MSAQKIPRHPGLFRIPVRYTCTSIIFDNIGSRKFEYFGWNWRPTNSILERLYCHCMLQAPTIARAASLVGIDDNIMDTMSLSSYMDEDEDEETRSLSPSISSEGWVLCGGCSSSCRPSLTHLCMLLQRWRTRCQSCWKNIHRCRDQSCRSKGKRWLVCCFHMLLLLLVKSHICTCNKPPDSRRAHAGGEERRYSYFYGGPHPS